MRDKVKRMSIKQRAEGMLERCIETFEEYEGVTYGRHIVFDDCETDMGKILFGEISALEELLSY